MRWSRPLVVALLLVPAAPCRAAIIHVPADQPTIQAGVDAAQSGDEVLVAPGVWTGPGNKNVDFHGKELAVVGEGGPDATVIDCEFQLRAFTLESYDYQAARIEGFTIRNGDTMDTYNPRGGGICCMTGRVTIRNCVLENGVAEEGGGISVSGGVIEQCVVRGNRAVEGWTGSGGVGGGISCGPEAVFIADCRIEGNSASESGAGGGVSGTAHMLRCLVAGNSAGGGGGVSLGNSSTMEGCVVTGNLGGGAMAFGWVTLRRSTIAGNRSPVQPGGGLLCLSPVDLEQVILFDNCAPAGGDEAWVYPVGSLSLTCCCTDSSGIDGSGSIEFGSENVFDDPRFCGPLACASAPATGGDYTLDASSPCRDDGNACGVWIGALGIGCQWPTPVEVGSWGRLKQQFR